MAGSGSDADGSVTSYKNGQSLPALLRTSIVNASSPVTDVTGLVEGVYQFQLTVTDNDGATDIDVMQVRVNPAPNQAPVANTQVPIIWVQP